MNTSEIRQGQAYETEEGLVIEVTDLYTDNDLEGWKMWVNYRIDDGGALYPERSLLSSFVKYLDDIGARLQA